MTEDLSYDSSPQSVSLRVYTGTEGNYVPFVTEGRPISTQQIVGAYNKKVNTVTVSSSTISYVFQ